ncbi:MAG: universal stress protein [Cyanobacteria bacterium J06607_15]
MISKILVALDLSANSEPMFNAAVSLAQTTGASLMLLHVVSRSEPGYPMLPTYNYYSFVDDREYDTYQKQLAEYNERGLYFLQSLTQRAIAKGITTEHTQLTGNPGRMICQLAANWSADLILVGSRGLKGLKEMFLGSVSNYVSHHAPCSILIVRTSTESASTKNHPELLTTSDETAS